jgi:hypothetical protein
MTQMAQMWRRALASRGGSENAGNAKNAWVSRRGAESAEGRPLRRILTIAFPLRRCEVAVGTNADLALFAPLR